MFVTVNRALLALAILALPLAGLSAGAAGQDSLQRLASLLEQRLDLGVEVARAKWNSSQPIRDEVREQAVIEATVGRAAALGIDVALARSLITDQIAASRLLQEELHEEWRRIEQQPFPDAADLRRDLRPKFDALGGDLLSVLKEAEPLLRTGEGRAAMHVAGLSVMAHRPEAVRARALALFR